MKVTVDTRHDSLEEALATVRAAFGSGENSNTPGERSEGSAKVTAKAAPTAKRARSAGRAATRRAAKRPPAKGAAATSRTRGKGRTSRSSMSPSSNVAPPGQADAIRAWAQAQGMEVKQAGRLPAVVIRAYRESNPS